MSDSEVLIYPDYVLKIQAESEETKNEKDIVPVATHGAGFGGWNAYKLSFRCIVQ